MVASQRIRTAGLALSLAAVSIIGTGSPAHALSMAARSQPRIPALPGGSCSGVQECNTFIAKCVGAGGEFVPGGTQSPSGQPTSGKCGPAQPLGPEED